MKKQTIESIHESIEFLTSLLPTEEQLRYEPEQNDHKGIVIKYDQVVVCEERAVKIVSIDVESWRGLPSRYLNGNGKIVNWVKINGKCCLELWQSGYKSTVFAGEKFEWVLKEGEIYSLDYFEAVSEFITLAVKNYRQISEQLKKETSSWGYRKSIKY